MLSPKTLLFILMMVTLFSCVKKTSEIIELDFEKDLIPEGIAVDPKTKTVYLNSLRHNKIVSSRLDGSNPIDFIHNNQYGYLPGFGMTIKDDTLYALGNSLQKNEGKSVLLLLDIRTGGLINSYAISDTTSIYLNDLAVSSNRDVYVTDSQSRKVYKVSNSHGGLQKFIENEEITNSNGIAISNDDKYLYLASANGIRIVDIKSKEVLNQANEEYAGIDGLKYYANSLIGIANAWRDPEKNGIFRYYLNGEGNDIIRKEKIVSFGDNFQVPTTFDMHDDTIYFIINTQLDNFNEETNQVIDPEHLRPYLLMRKKIL